MDITKAFEKRMNKFLRPEKYELKEPESGIQMSEELLHKSAQKLLNIIKTPNSKSARSNSAYATS